MKVYDQTLSGQTALRVYLRALRTAQYTALDMNDTAAADVIKDIADRIEDGKEYTFISDIFEGEVIPETFESTGRHL